MSDLSGLSKGPSLWEATSFPAPECEALNRDVKTDVAIIGAGYTGLSAAHFLAKAGIEPLVLDANAIGWGCSGRNGGFISTRFRTSFASLASSHGRAVSDRMRQIALEAVENVREIIEELDIACDYHSYGAIFAAHNDKAMASLRAATQWVRDELGERDIEEIDRDTVIALTGSTSFVGGNLMPKVGAVHPLNFARGMARSLHARGVPMFGNSPVLSITQKAGGVELRTPRQLIWARHVIIGTDGYTSLTNFVPSLAKSLVTFPSALIATAKLDPGLLSSVLPQGHILSDTRRLLRYGRVYDGRLLFGGRGAFDGDASGSAYRRLRSEMVKAYPQLASVPIDYGWSGFVAMTLDGLPRMGQLGDHVHYALGYNGTGLAMSNMLGRFTAEKILRKTIDTSLLSSPLPRVPFHSLRVPVVRAATRWYQFLDQFA
ncbi:NAD(P)/FAD-dependent oxidoreductase [Sphingomonas crocodyli]|uniref:FAD-binding oxidoreductase n=1 Tax=Sphingomonas crocodyli TaxID=1979270 RepID=A0A437M5G0_9SPHN|nr:FAD-binding oxidoreductase [Sphingomonas crocodyli]RVT92917.1 FAD-binding oxidoreductase [Sphingomonas crocodyli]